MRAASLARDADCLYAALREHFCHGTSLDALLARIRRLEPDIASEWGEDRIRRALRELERQGRVRLTPLIVLKPLPVIEEDEDECGPTPPPRVDLTLARALRTRGSEDPRQR